LNENQQFCTNRETLIYQRFCCANVWFKTGS
jgi:hypothetical protein